MDRNIQGNSIFINFNEQYSAREYAISMGIKIYMKFAQMYIIIMWNRFIFFRTSNLASNAMRKSNTIELIILCVI